MKWKGVHEMNSIESILGMIWTEANEDTLAAEKNKVPSVKPPDSTEKTIRYDLQLVTEADGKPVWVED